MNKKIIRSLIVLSLTLGISTNIPINGYASSCRLINRSNSTVKMANNGGNSFVDLSFSNTSNTSNTFGNDKTIKSSNFAAEINGLKIDKNITNDVTLNYAMDVINTLSTRFPLRYSESENNLKAIDYIKNELESFGYETIIEDFEDESGYWSNGNDEVNNGKNIIGKSKSHDSSKKDIIIVSHFDTFNVTPGANDNGTGVGINLALANHFKNSTLPYNLVFLFVDGEELGLQGSRAYVAKHKDELVKNTELAINVDMVGKGTHYEINFVKESSKEEKYPKLTYDIAKILGLDIKFHAVTGSDYVSFENAGINSLGLYKDTGAWKGKDSTYHKPTDTFDGIDKSSIKDTLNIILNLIYNIK